MGGCTGKGHAMLNEVKKRQRISAGSPPRGGGTQTATSKKKGYGKMVKTATQKKSATQGEKKGPQTVKN